MSKIIKTKSFELAIYTCGNSKAEKLALILPGRLDTKDYANNISHVNYLANKGYLAISFDPPGVWESSGSIKEYTTTNYLRAINELIEYYGNRPTLLLGHSRGGTVAMLAGINNSCVTSFIAIMSYYGAPSKPTKKEKQQGRVDELRDTPPGGFRTKKQKLFKLPMSYFKDGKKYNALKDLKVCKKPKLFIYSPIDKLNSVKDMKRMYGVSSKPKEIHSVRSEHDYRRNSQIIRKINNLIGRFLKRYSK